MRLYIFISNKTMFIQIVDLENTQLDILAFDTKKGY